MRKAPLFLILTGILMTRHAAADSICRVYAQDKTNPTSITNLAVEVPPTATDIGWHVWSRNLVGGLGSDSWVKCQAKQPCNGHTLFSDILPGGTTAAGGPWYGTTVKQTGPPGTGDQFKFSLTQHVRFEASYRFPGPTCTAVRSLTAPPGIKKLEDSGSNPTLKMREAFAHLMIEGRPGSPPGTGHKHFRTWARQHNSSEWKLCDDWYGRPQGAQIKDACAGNQIWVGFSKEYDDEKDRAPQWKVICATKLTTGTDCKVELEYEPLQVTGP